jgi:D-glycero-D-manno-heptose 1,7-bisphosphate phosphatase
MRVVFLDRDGVINKAPRLGDYLVSWGDFNFLPGVFEGIQRLNKLGFSIIVITNQACVVKGLISREALERIHANMIAAIDNEGGKIEQVYYCPHKEGDGCDCRKPEPGMLLQAISDFDLNPAECWMVGDSQKDVDAGKAAGCRTYKTPSDSNFLEIVKHIESILQGK